MMPKYFSDAVPQEHGGNGQQHVVEAPTTRLKMGAD